MKRAIGSFAAAVLIVGIAFADDQVAPPMPDVVTRILFGSCIKQDQPTPIFYSMMAERPDLMLFLGDNIYADTTDIELMRTKYDRLGANPLFVQLRATAPILATWDDHDYGVNDGGAEFPMRDASQQAFLDFWNVPAESLRRTRRGVYHSRTFGPSGRRVQIILLDTRYFRSPLSKGERRVGGPYLPSTDSSKTMLGEPQWKWLESRLREPADLRVVGSSIQCIAEAAGQETWSNFPHERQKLFDVIRSTKAGGVILVSGDRHWSELSVVAENIRYPLYELTSSSFNQIHGRGTPTENQFRAVDSTYHRENYGMILVDWDASDPTVTLQIRDIERGVRIEKKLRVDSLK